MRALSEVLGATLPYDETAAIRDRMWEVAPSLVRYDELEQSSAVLAGLKSLAEAKTGAPKKDGARTGAFQKPIDNFYRTDPISRSSVTMSKCTRAFVEGGEASVAAAVQRA